MNKDSNLTITITEPSADYELIDSGDNEKLERYGEVVLRRPDPQALWHKTDEELWESAHGSFMRDGRDGTWHFTTPVPEKWTIHLADLQFYIRPTAFKHTGIFPEQVSNWRWMQGLIQNSNRDISVLNLFGYTGGATLACAQAGAKVCHVDASKPAIGWAKNNALLSGLENAPIRWILDDAQEFVKRELKRGVTYDAIIMDPPAFGRGPKGNTWQIEDDFIPFVDECKKLLSPSPLFFLLNGYAAGYSQLVYKYNLEDMLQKFGGEIESGELTIRESKSKRLLPCGIFARWKA